MKTIKIDQLKNCSTAQIKEHLVQFAGKRLTLLFPKKFDRVKVHTDLIVYTLYTEAAFIGGLLSMACEGFSYLTPHPGMKDPFRFIVDGADAPLLAKTLHYITTVILTQTAI